MDFTGKVIIITGASSGIGAESAKLFAANGAHLTVVGRNEERLQKVVEACQSVKGSKPLSLLLDLTHEGKCEEVVKKTIDKFGKIDVLLNSAGKAMLTSLFDQTMDVFDELIALNLRVPYKLTQLCVPHLVKTRGNIVNVIGAPLRSRPGFLPFAMIRDAMERFTKNGSLELITEGIRMNSVRPGLTRTNFLENFNISPDCADIAYESLAESSVPNGRVIEPDEIARTILFLASNVCPSMAGSNVTVDCAASHY